VNHAPLVDAFWVHHRLSSSGARDERLDADTYFWAWEQVHETMRQGDLEAVELLVALADAVSPDDVALAYLGAGPLEDLLCSGGQAPSDSLLDSVETAARQHAGFRAALQGVWWGENDEITRSRLARFLSSSE
jgi:hypothetical protein